MKRNIIITDYETGGYSAQENPITQVGLEVIDPADYRLILSYDTFVKPYDDLIITKGALEASRVTMKEINNGIDARDLLKKLISIFKEAKTSSKGESGLPILAGHNLKFDIPFLKYLFAKFNQDLYDYVGLFYYDTMQLYLDAEAHERGADKRKYNLTNLCERYGISLTSAHGAPADVAVTKQLLILYLNRVRNATPSGNITEAAAGNRIRSRDKITFQF